MVNKLLLTVDEVAEVLGLSRRTVYELLRTNQLKSVKIGGCRRIAQSALGEYVAWLQEFGSPLEPAG